MKGAIHTWKDVTAPVELTCDVCIVGSGAGGAVLAAGLVEAGLSVVMLEEGSHMTRADFTLQEAEMMPAMYQERGTRGTADGAITVMQGRSVGGSTTVNWTTCFRTPAAVQQHWAQHHGIDDLGLDPHFEAVELRLSVAEWPEAIANPNNRVLLDGARALGWEAKALRRNVKGCANSGYCGVGCPVDGKQAMGITYLQDAVGEGLQLYANVRVERLEVDGDRVVAVHGRGMSPQAGAPDGPAVVVRPKVAVSSGGAINGPALLLRSGLTADGRVGRRTFLHPVIGTFARFEHVINPFWGAPQSVGSHQFIDRGPDRVGYFLEVPPLQPMLASVGMAQFGADLREAIGDLPHTNAVLGLMRDGILPGDDGGTVSLRPDGTPRLDYPVRPFLQEAFRHAFEQMMRIQLAAGATIVGSGHYQPVVARSEADLAELDRRAYGAHEHMIFTAHQMGGCTMGGDPSTSVVDTEHRFRGVPNLFVVDGSVLPTSLGVNPSETIYGLAHRARRFVGEAV
ncbi:MAG: GMC family oxidoreductase [Alphaproteobacteria bacterium]|nr:GMC family oxidoreductase [Alphaproteobacteria bacterium]